DPLPPVTPVSCLVTPPPMQHSHGPLCYTWSASLQQPVLVCTTETSGYVKVVCTPAPPPPAAPKVEMSRDIRAPGLAQVAAQTELQLLNSMRAVVLARHQQNILRMLADADHDDLKSLGPALEALGRSTAFILAELRSGGEAVAAEVAAATSGAP